MNHLTDEQINEYLDGVLEPGMHLAAQTHLHACEPCRRRLAQLHIVFAAFESLPTPALKTDLAPLVRARLPHRRGFVWTPAFAAQMGAALGALAWAAQFILRLRLPSPSAWLPSLPLSAFFPSLPSFAPSSVFAPLFVNPALVLPTLLSAFPTPNLLLPAIYPQSSLSLLLSSLLATLHGSLTSLLPAPLTSAASPFDLLGIGILCAFANVALLRKPGGAQA